MSTSVGPEGQCPRGRGLDALHHRLQPLWHPPQVRLQCLRTVTVPVPPKSSPDNARLRALPKRARSEDADRLPGRTSDRALNWFVRSTAPCRTTLALRSNLLRTAPLIQFCIPAGAVFQAVEKRHESY